VAAVLQPIAFGDVPYLRNVGLGLNQMLASEAAANGAADVDTATATIGYDACRPTGTRCVKGEIPTSSPAPWHPNELGEKSVAARVEAAIGQPLDHRRAGNPVQPGSRARPGP